MNSIFTNNGDDDLDDSRYPKSRLTILKCGTPSGAMPITIPTSGTPSATTLTSLTTNTSCFSSPCLKLEFACNVSVPSANDITLYFQVYKQVCDAGESTAVGPVWTFTRALGVVIPEGTVYLITADPVSFFVCDCDGCACECCTYYVAVTPKVNATGDTITINSATLAAIVVDSANQYCQPGNP